MWELNDAKDLENYFKIIEEEAKELHESKPLGRAQEPKFRGGNNGGGDGGYNYGGNSNYNSRGNGNYGFGSDNYGRSNNGSNNYGNYGSNQSGNFGYGGNSNNGESKPLGNVQEHNFGGGNNGSGGGYNYGGNSNYNSRGNGNYDFGSNKEAKELGESKPEEVAAKSNPTTIYYSNYAMKCVSQNPENVASVPEDPNEYQRTDYSQNRENVASISEDPNGYQGTDYSQNRENVVSVPEDPDGYQRTDYNRCLIAYTKSNLTIRHIFLTVFQKEDLMDYTTKIMECTSQDKLLLSIQRDNQLAEAFSAQLRGKGFWSIEVTNKTVDPEKLANQMSVYRCIVTTMAFLRDNPNMFKRPAVVMNFDHVVNHVKFLERWLNYRALHSPSVESTEDAFIYEMCFQSSTTSDALKEYVQNKLSEV